MCAHGDDIYSVVFFMNNVEVYVLLFSESAW